MFSGPRRHRKCVAKRASALGGKGGRRKNKARLHRARRRHMLLVAYTQTTPRQHLSPPSSVAQLATAAAAASMLFFFFSSTHILLLPMVVVGHPQFHRGSAGRDAKEEGGRETADAAAARSGAAPSLRRDASDAGGRRLCRPARGSLPAECRSGPPAPASARCCLPDRAARLTPARERGLLHAASRAGRRKARASSRFRRKDAAADDDWAPDSSTAAATLAKRLRCGALVLAQPTHSAVRHDGCERPWPRWSRHAAGRYACCAYDTFHASPLPVGPH